MIEGVAEVHVFDRTAFSKELTSGNLNQAYQRLSGLVLELKRYSFDRVSNITHTPESGFLAGLAGAKHCAGTVAERSGAYSEGNWSRLFQATLPRRDLGSFHLVDLHLKLAGLGSPDFGRSWLKKPNCLPVKLSDRRPLLTIQLGANNPLRMWDVEAFATAAKLAVQALPSLAVALVGSGNEELLAADFERLFGREVISLVGRTSLTELAGVIGQSSVVLSGDTGTIHLAAALNVPTVGVYLGMARADDTAPYRKGSVIFEPRRECYPCPENHRCSHVSCHNDIPVEAVAAALLDTIEGKSPQPEQKEFYRRRVVAFDEDGCLQLGDPPHSQLQNARQLRRQFWLREFTSPPMPSSPKSFNSATRELEELATAALSAARRLELALIGGHPATKVNQALRQNLQELEMTANRRDESGLLAHLFQLELENMPVDPRLIAGRITAALENLQRRSGQFPAHPGSITLPLRVAI